MKKITSFFCPITVLLAIYALCFTAAGCAPYRAKDINVTFSFKDLDFGDIVPGNAGATNLVIHNREKYGIRFAMIKCECIELSDNNFLLAGGGTKVLDVRYESVGYSISGKIEKIISVIMTPENGSIARTESLKLTLRSVLDSTNRPFTSRDGAAGFSFKFHDFGDIPVGSASYSFFTVKNRTNFSLRFRFDSNANLAPSENDFTVAQGETKTVDMVFTAPQMKDDVLFFPTKVTMESEGQKYGRDELIYVKAGVFNDKNKRFFPEDISGNGKRKYLKVVLLTEKGGADCNNTEKCLRELVNEKNYKLALNKILEPDSLPIVQYLTVSKKIEVSGYPVLILGDKVLTGKSAANKDFLMKTLDEYANNKRYASVLADYHPAWNGK